MSTSSHVDARPFAASRARSTVGIAPGSLCRSLPHSPLLEEDGRDGGRPNDDHHRPRGITLEEEEAEGNEAGLKKHFGDDSGHDAPPLVRRRSGAADDTVTSLRLRVRQTTGSR